MNRVAQLSLEERRELWIRSADRLHPLPALMVEKDFWVCWTLRQLFALPGARDHFIFKGGTSLAKVWRVIHRFSEDIDISFSREWLGFGGEDDPEVAPTRKQRKLRLEVLSHACACQLAEEVLPALMSAFSGVLNEKGWSLEIDSADPQTLLFSYPTVFAKDIGSAYVRPVVRIECGARSDRWPVVEGLVTPYVAEAFPESLPDTSTSLPVLSVERTFWEKASILHAEFHRPPKKPIPGRYSRHYADMAALALSEHCAAALERADLRDRVIAHKLIFFPAVWARTETAVPGTFRLVPPPARGEEIARDYTAMREMFFCEPAPWKEILGALKDLETRINDTGV